MQFAVYIRPEYENKLNQRFFRIHSFDVDAREAVELKEAFDQCMNVLSHPGKIRVAPFPTGEEPPETFDHEDDLNEVCRQNRSKPTTGPF